jgi:mono/diheme cytochrome c family protein
MSAVVFRSASAAVIVLVAFAVWGLSAIGRDGAAQPGLKSPQDAKPAVSEGQRVFRFETFGDEEFWTDKARMHEVVSKSVSPSMALKVGLKVDAEAIPADVAAAIKSGKVDLESPATTVTLLKLNAVVGLKGTVETVDGKDRLVRLGITCALCHSTVDDSFSKGIGRRQDGWPNRDLNVGAIIALSPAITPEQKAVYNSWGPGKYDPRYNLDGKSTPLVLPPAYGLARVKNETYTAEGPISYWNAYVAVTQMHGHGNFSDPRLKIEVQNTPDMVTPMLPALADYQHSLPAPPPPAGSFDVAAAGRGRLVFDRSCMGCHVDTNNTDNNAGTLHQPSDTGMDGAYAARTANKAYRTTPLRGLWQHPPYFHDGSAATLDAVVDHYDRVRKLSLTTEQKKDLVQFLKSF